MSHCSLVTPINFVALALFICIPVFQPLGMGQAAPPKPAPEVQALQDQARAETRVGKNEEALRLWNLSLTKAQELKDLAGESRALLNIGNLYRLRVQPDKALEYCRQALAINRTVGFKQGEADALNGIALAYQSAGKRQELLEPFEQALKIYRALRDKSGEARALNNLAICYRDSGLPQKSIEYFEEALTLYRVTGDRGGEARALNGAGLAYHNASQSQKAIEYLNQSLEIYRTVAEKSGEARALNNLGIVYRDISQPPKATAYFQQALILFRVVSDKGGEARALAGLGVLYQNTAQPRKAMEVFQQALPLYREVKDKSGEAAALAGLGVVYREISQPQKAMEYLQLALPIFRAMRYKPGEARALNSIGLVYLQTGETQKAKESFQLALPLYRETENKGGEAAALSNLALVYQNMGQPQKSIELIERAIPLYRVSESRSDEAGALYNLGIVYRDIGQPQKAMEYIQRALPIFRAAGSTKGEARALNSLGIVYLKAGQPRKALQLCEQSLPLFRAGLNRGGEAAALSNLGIAYRHIGQPQKAVDHFQQAMPYFRAARDKLGEARALIGFGRLYLITGRPRKAKALFHQALTLYRAAGSKPGEASALSNLGVAYNEDGQSRKAIKYCLQALSLFRSTGHTDGEADTLQCMSLAERALHRMDAAESHNAQAVTLLETLRARFGGYSESKSAFLASNLSIYYSYLNILLERGQIARSFDLAQRTKARALLDLLAFGRVDLGSELTPEERTEEEGLQQQANFLNGQMVNEGVVNAVGSKRRFADLRLQLRDVESRLQTLTDSLYAHHPGLAQKRVAHIAALAETAKFLPPDTALLDYVFVSKDEVRLFVVTVDNGNPVLRSFPIKVRAERLAELAAAFRAACADPRKEYLRHAIALHGLLIRPAGKALAGKKRLLVCPDGPLWDVPFHALVTGGTRPRFLCERYEIAYAYSATGAQAALTVKAGRKKSEGTLLALANPDFGSNKRFGDLQDLPGQRPFDLPSRPFDLPSRPIDLPSRAFDSVSRTFETLSRGGGIAALPGTQREADALKKDFPGASIYTGVEAQESVIKREGGKYRYLHFATHGFFNDAAPLLSSIVLAQPEKGSKEDGFLTAREIFDMDLSAEMVVLSACNTARGVQRSGDGVVGLTWALFVAGCPTQVVSQWSVDDASTATLMESFYSNLTQKKLGKGAALRQASLALMKDPKHRHPYYWAPFVLMGDWR